MVTGRFKGGGLWELAGHAERASQPNRHQRRRGASGVVQQHGDVPARSGSGQSQPQMVGSRMVGRVQHGWQGPEWLVGENDQTLCYEDRHLE
jgi:hypothetical protein